MSAHLKGTLRFFALVALFPFATGFIGSWLEGLGFFLFLFGIPAAFLILLVGATLHGIKGVKLAREATKGSNRLIASVAAPILLVATILVASPLLRTGSVVGSFTRLMVNRSHYEAIIARVRSDQQPAWFEIDQGVTYSVDLGPPVRVAFNPAGLLDNWSGIIYDPTGDVMLAHGFDQRTGKFVAPDRITKLFGGDLVGCRHLWGDYYDCSFT